MESIAKFLYSYPFIFILIAFGLGWSFMPFVLRVAHVRHLEVKPNKRTSHNGDVPNIGGIDIFVSFLLSCMVFEYDRMLEAQFVLVGVFVMLMVGFVDDMVVIKPLHKILGELLAGFMLIVMAGCRLQSLHGLFGIDLMSPYLSIPISFFVLIAMTNAINLIDGVDGLASGLGIIYSLFFGIYFSLAGQGDLAVMAFCLVGSLAVFFIYNVFGNRHHKIFMGDSGSLTLGYMVTFFTFEFCNMNAGVAARPGFVLPEYLHCEAAPGVLICMMCIPVFDTLRVMLTRIRKGASPFAADRNHLHHLLLGLGLKHIQVTMIILAFTLLGVGIGLLGRQMSWWWLVMLMFAVFCIAVWVLWRVIDRKNRMSDDKC